MKSESRLAEILTGGPLENVLVHCRPTDLVVIGQANPDKPEPMRELLIETVLFESGVPVLLVPYIGSKSFQPKNVLVGWDAAPPRHGPSMRLCPFWKRRRRSRSWLLRRKPRKQPANRVPTSPTIWRATTWMSYSYVRLSIDDVQLRTSEHHHVQLRTSDIDDVQLSEDLVYN